MIAGSWSNWILFYLFYKEMLWLQDFTSDKYKCYMELNKSKIQFKKKKSVCEKTICSMFVQVCFSVCVHASPLSTIPRAQGPFQKV